MLKFLKFRMSLQYLLSTNMLKFCLHFDDNINKVLDKCNCHIFRLLTKVNTV